MAADVTGVEGVADASDEGRGETAAEVKAAEEASDENEEEEARPVVGAAEDAPKESREEATPVGTAAEDTSEGRTEEEAAPVVRAVSVGKGSATVKLTSGTVTLRTKVGDHTRSVPVTEALVVAATSATTAVPIKVAAGNEEAGVLTAISLVAISLVVAGSANAVVVVAAPTKQVDIPEPMRSVVETVGTGPSVV